MALAPWLQGLSALTSLQCYNPFGSDQPRLTNAGRAALLRHGTSMLQLRRLVVLDNWALSSAETVQPLLPHLRAARPDMVFAALIKGECDDTAWRLVHDALALRSAAGAR